ncbi:ABC transporter ATP-binding protein [Isoptericola aurantiacus]|uniref:ABC transporter ATP-binding protein n=1 Tax=Isoptericola aurantiacus TaxID=3377839 RepID=UPI00383A5432
MTTYTRPDARAGAPAAVAPAPPRLTGTRLTLRYGDRTVTRDLDVAIPDGKVTAIVGPNACGKSTLLRALSRVLAPTSGVVRLDGTPLGDLGTKEVARRIALLPQGAEAPEGITVADLVGRGRFPHQTFFRPWSDADAAAVRRALDAAGVADLADRQLDELSGGQRQRVWIATVLAQDTPILLLDEPTTFLDIGHQFEVLELCRELNEDHGVTVVAVLHDLQQAARYADHLVVMHDGAVVAEGGPSEVLDAALVERVFGLPCRVVPDPVAGTPMVVALGRRTR